MAQSKPKMTKPSVGIDLGTTYSCVAIFQNGKPEVIANSQGNRITPSVVAFTKEGRLIGEGAEIQRKLDPPNAIYNAKRFIGRPWNDPTVLSNRSMYPFRVVENNTKIQFQVENGPKSVNLTPEEIAAAILSKMKKTAEDYLEETVEDVVITVPAYFTDSQRQATVNAGKIAGLNVTRIINEPTAAAMAYGLREGTKGDKGKRILVYDLGGGTFDVSVLEIEEDLIRVRATDGNSNLGGEDFNDLLVNHFKQEINRKHKVDISPNCKCLRRLTGACEKLKRNLSAENVRESKIELDNFLPDGKDFLSTLTRAKFENICKKRFEETIKCVDKVLQYAWLTKEEIDEIVLVGGSSRIPKLQAMLSSYFNNKVLNKSINPDEAVACGAAVQAAILNNDPHLSVKDLLLMDVLPLSIGLTMQSKLTQVILERNTTIPVRKTTIVTTGLNNQTCAKFEITEGERNLSADNRNLGSFDVDGLPKRKAGEVRFEVLFEMDENGILSVMAAVQGSNQEGSITLDVRSAGKLSHEDVSRLVKEAEKMKTVDQKEENRIVAMNKLISLCNHISFIGQDLSEKDLGNVLKSVEDTLIWVTEHPDAKIGQFIGNYNVLKDKAANVLNIPAMQDLSMSASVPHMSKLKYYMKEGRDLLLSGNGNDSVKAADYFFRAYIISNEDGNMVKEVEALVHFSRAHKMLVATGCTDQLKMKHAAKAIKGLSLVMAREQNKTLSEDDREAVVEDLQFVVKEALKVIENQKEKRMLNYLDILMRALDQNRKDASKNPAFCQIVFECRIKEIKTYVKKVDTCLDDENIKEAQNYLQTLNYAKEQAKLLAKSLEEKLKLVEVIELVQRKTSHAEGLKQMNLAVNLLEGANVDDPDTIDKALMALDHIIEAKHLTEGKHHQIFIKANFLEGNIFMDYIPNSSKAKTCFEKVITVSDLNGCNNEEYRQAKFILSEIQREQLKEDIILPVSRENLLHEVKPDLQKIKEADSSMSDETFLDFLLTEYPPKHKENITRPQFTSFESIKRAYIRLCVFYHPDKVDAAQYGQKHKILCGEISKFVNGRFLKM